MHKDEDDGRYYDEGHGDVGGPLEASVGENSEVEADDGDFGEAEAGEVEALIDVEELESSGYVLDVYVPCVDAEGEHTGCRPLARVS